MTTGEPKDPDDGAEVHHTTSEDDTGGSGRRITRRNLLIGGGSLAMLGGAIASSRYLFRSGSPDGPNGPIGLDTLDCPPGHSSAGDGDLFTVWEEIRDALRTSPDHLPARAEQLVAEGTPSAIFRFVRDEVVTYPAGMNEPGEIDHRMRWGVRGTLRGGAGTPREKAQLLVDLYRRAGFDAEVLVGDVRIDRPDVQGLFWRSSDLEFAPDVDDEQVCQWLARTGGSLEGATQFELIDEDDQESQRLARELLQQLPEEGDGRQSFRWDWSAPTPIVRVVADGEEYYANLFAPDAPFGDPGLAVPELDPAPPPSDTLPVEITLSAATVSDPAEPFDLVTNSWNADELVGRQILVQMLPGIDPFEGEGSTFNDVRVFGPALTIQAMDLNQEEMAALSVMGDPVTRSVAPLQVDDDEPDALQLCGLYLTVSVGDREVTRTLAGYDPVRHDDQAVTQAMLDEVSGALFASNYLSFEAVAPPVSVWLDDLLSARLTVAPLHRALRTGDAEEIEAQRMAGFAHIPPELVQLVPPLPEATTETSLTFQGGLRVTLYEERPVFGADHFVRRADILPFSGFATAAADGDERFRVTLEKSAHLAILEDALFETSTRSLLEGQSLAEYSAVRDGWDPERQRTWSNLVESSGLQNHQLVPEGGDRLTFWNVDSRTGELLGVLWDGSGGGVTQEPIREQVLPHDLALSMLKWHASYMGGYAAGALVAYAELGVALGETLIDQMEHLLDPDFDEEEAPPPGLSETMREFLGMQVCNLVRDAHLGAFIGKPATTTINRMENFIGMIGIPVPGCGDLVAQ